MNSVSSKKEAVRIAVRANATELSREQTKMVSGAMMMAGNTGGGNTPLQCDPNTNCWVEGGNHVTNDD